MFRLAVLVFIVVPIVEIYLIIQVGSLLGGLETIGLLILVSVVGAWLVRREGFSLFVKVQQSLARGELPTDPLIDGLLVLFASALLLTPGFLTDGFGLTLLFPPTRILMRGWLKRRFAGRISVGGGAYGRAGFTDVTWVDTTSDDEEEPPGAIELGPVSDD